MPRIVPAAISLIRYAFFRHIVTKCTLDRSFSPRRAGVRPALLPWQELYASLYLGSWATKSEMGKRLKLIIQHFCHLFASVNMKPPNARKYSFM